MEKTRLKRGGARPGAGRKPQLTTQIAKAERLALQLRESLKLGLYTLATEYESIMQIAIGEAKAGDKAMIRFLLQLPAGLVKFDDPQESPMAKLLQEFRQEIHIHANPEVAGPGRVIDSTARHISE